MDARQLRLGLGWLAVALTVAACAGGSVTIKTGEEPHPSNEAPGCYTSGTSGELVTDPTAGTAIVEESGQRVAVTWPVGWTGRQAGSEVEVLDASGAVRARTGTGVYLMGGYWYVDGSFLTCGPASR